MSPRKRHTNLSCFRSLTTPALVIGIAACGGGGTEPAAPVVPGSLVAHSPLTFQGIAGSSTSISLKVTSGSGAALRDISVSFEVTKGAGSVAPSTAVTNVDGLVTVSWTLDRSAGLNTLVASVAPGHGGTAAPVTFSGTGLSGPAARVVVVAGAGQTAIVGTPTATAPVMKVVDANDNPVAGMRLTFSVDGGGTIDRDTATTGQDGTATVRSWRLGTKAGANTVTATVQDLTPVVVTAVGIADVPAKMVKVSGDTQVDTSSATLAIPLTVRVVDQYDNPALGADVVFSTIPGAGTVTPTSTRVGADGNASTRWTLGQQIGTDSVRVTVTGSALAPVRFLATVRTQPLQATDVTSGHMFSCAVLKSRRVYCWGNNEAGQLGNGTETRSERAERIISNLEFVEVEAGFSHACALTVVGEAWCWGKNSWGQVGDGTELNERWLPTRVAGVPSFVKLALGAESTCALTQDGRVFCWGFMIGANSVTPPAAVEVSGATRFATLSASVFDLCGVDTSGVTHCMVPMIDPTKPTVPFPTYHWQPRAHNLNARALSFAIHADTACAATDLAELHCFTLVRGVTGAIDWMSGVSRLLVTAGSIVAVHRGWSSSCVTTAGPLLCWGNNTWGQLGTVPGVAPSNVGTVAPAMLSNPRFLKVSGGAYHTCGISDASLVLCWGLGNLGQLGDGPHAEAFFWRHVPGAVQRR